MPPGVRRFAWWSFSVTEVSLVTAASAYVGFGTREFWLVVGAAAVAAVAYAIAVRRTPVPKLGEASAAQERWYWF
jgi:hypothetical protein